MSSINVIWFCSVSLFLVRKWAAVGAAGTQRHQACHPVPQKGEKKKRKIFYFSETLRPEPCDTEVMPNNRTKALSHCVRDVWLCIWPPPLQADNISVTVLSISSHDGCLLQENCTFILVVIGWIVIILLHVIYVLLFPTTSVSYVPFLII